MVGPGARLASVVADAGVAAAVLSGLIVMAMLATRQPARRRTLARVGVVGLLLAIPTAWARPVPSIDLATPLRIAWEPTAEWIGDRLGLPAPAAPPAWLRRGTPGARAIGGVLLGAYLVGVVASLARLGLGWWGSGWIGRNSRPATAEMLGIYAGLPRFRTRPRLRMSDRTTQPALLGTFRPTILIPPRFARPEAADDLRLSLLHELAHAEAADPLFGLATEVASALWFPLPMLWWIRRQMRLDQEYLADRRASDTFGTARRYATSLVEIAATPDPERTDGHTPARTPRPSGADSALFRRVLLLVRSPFPVEGRPPSWWRWTAIVAAAVALPAVTAITLRSTIAPRGLVATPTRAPRELRIAKLILTDSPSAAAPALLPVRLPRTFRLDFEVFATSAELAQMRVIDLPLSVGRVADNPHLVDPARWHRVRLSRADGQLTLAVDAHPPTASVDRSTADRLAIRSIPDRPTSFRSIRLSY